MPGYNKNFELSIEDLDLIEEALRARKLDEAQAGAKAGPATEKVRDIHDLLGRLHNQQTFYRPAKGPYVSG